MNNISTQSLSEIQREAVTYIDGPLLVVAGAGAGKTRVLTCKIAYLLECGVLPWRILALTFTNKAAKEMKDRIGKLIGGAHLQGLRMGTFHSMFLRILHEEIAHTDFQKDFSIYDSADTKSLIKSIVKEMGLDEKVYKASYVASRISEGKNQLLTPEAYEANTLMRHRDKSNNVEKVYEIYLQYRQRCITANAMDFDDLLLNTYLLFDRHPEVRAKYANLFEYILVDEYQDTNFAQHKIIAQLTHPASKICVVGDDAQSIYGFRGAEIDNILQFTQQYPGAKVVKLEQNYRSTQTIVNAANSIIKHNKYQIPKVVYSRNEVGEKIPIITAFSDKEESTRVVGKLQYLKRKESLEYNQIAILYRTNAQSRGFEDALRNEGIPYRIHGGLSFYQRKEIKDVVAYMRVVCNPNDEEALRRIINYPARGIGKTTEAKLIATATAHNVSIWEVLTNLTYYDVNINKGTAAKLGNFVQLIEGFSTAASSMSGYKLASRIINESGIAAEYSRERSPENLSALENLEELLNAISTYEADLLEEEGQNLVTLSDYLAQISLLTDADKNDDGLPKVTLMTVHAAKGLEYDAVFVTGMEDDLFPNASSRYNPKEMEEERRLFYVAVTRAKRFCCLSFARSRFKFGSVEVCEPSPFLSEINSQYVASDSSLSASASNAKNYFHKSEQTTASQRFTKITPPTARFKPVSNTASNYSSATTANASATNTFKVGDKVKHERFGVGVVIELEGSGAGEKARVRFEYTGEKSLLLKFAKMTKIN